MIRTSPQDGAVRLGSTWWRFPPLRNVLIASSIALVAWLLARNGLLPRGVENAVFVAAMLLGGWHWTQEAFETLIRERAIGIEFLMLAATLGSIALGMWDEAVTLVLLFGAAEGVEEYTHARTRNAVRALMDLVPAEASIVRGGEEARAPATELKPGDRFRVRPGEQVATDGRVIEGRSSVNQAPITGESTPVDKETGDEVFAGSINGDGVLLIEATRAFADNSIARIIHRVEQAQEEKGRAQQWIERFGRRYTPAVLAAAVVLIAVPALIGLPLALWAHKAIVFLVAAAPCALVMSTPMAMAAGIGRASRRGILIKGGVHLEHLAAVRWVAFDKTGTLTVGTPRLVNFDVLEGSEENALAIAAGLESCSRHPLAAGVVEGARERDVQPSAVSDFAAMTGSGVSGRVGGTLWYVATAAWFSARLDLAESVIQRIDALRSSGRTVALLGTDERIFAILGLLDSARPEAPEALRQLHALGIGSAMLSGDHTRTAQAIAKQLGIDDARGELKPDDKVSAIARLQSERGPVLMVGDGVNDAPALASASCGAAMGAAGSDAAIEAADVALMSDDLRKIPLALAIGRHVRRISRQNITLSIAVLVAMIPAALMGWIGITTAVLVHEAAELLAVVNGLRAGAGAEEALDAKALATKTLSPAGRPAS